MNRRRFTLTSLVKRIISSPGTTCPRKEQSVTRVNPTNRASPNTLRRHEARELRSASICRTPGRGAPGGCGRGPRTRRRRLRQSTASVRSSFHQMTRSRCLISAVGVDRLDVLGPRPRLVHVDPVKIDQVSFIRGWLGLLVIDATNRPDRRSPTKQPAAPPRRMRDESSPSMSQGPLPRSSLGTGVIFDDRTDRLSGSGEVRLLDQPFWA